MVNKRSLVLLFTVIVCVLISFNIAAGAKEQLIYPGETWLQYAKPEEAGFSSTKLAQAKKFSQAIGSDAVLVVYDGVVLTSWGDIDRRYMCHSVRKSFLSALYGIYVEQGKINVNKNLADLGITENGKLTAEEQQARVSDLLKARSGVYIPAAYETKEMAKSRPERGSHGPGTYWYYNNWDFNVLGTIFEQETGKKIFEEFETKIADPLQMQDYRVMDGYYHYEKEKSIYPAYPFKMSARDMARFGLLYLRHGKWRDQQIIPEHWIDESTRSYSNTGIPVFGYGYLWWVNNVKDSYEAQGVGVQTIDILPKEKIVFVHRVNTYEEKNVSYSDISVLLNLILNAKVRLPKSSPKMKKLSPVSEKKKGIEINEDILNRYAGKYLMPTGIVIEIVNDSNHLIFQDPHMGNFCLIPYEQSKFYLEDIGEDSEFLEFKDREIVIHENNNTVSAKKVPYL